MAIAGQRFHIDLPSDEEEPDQLPSSRAGGSGGNSEPTELTSSSSIVRDITERLPSSSATPALPKLPEKRPDTGFPAHKKRFRASAPKNQRASAGPAGNDGVRRGGEGFVASKATQGTDPRRDDRQGEGDLLEQTSEETELVELDRQRIDQENKERLAQMSDEEIQQERQELLQGLSPSLVERLLAKRSASAARSERGREGREGTVTEGQTRSTSVKQSSTSPADPDAAITSASRRPDLSASESVEIPSQSTSQPSSSRPTPTPTATATSTPHTTLPPVPKIHFPAPPSTTTTPSALDPSSPDFLTQLHEKYYPDLPTDPSKLAWMAPVTPSTLSTYSPTLSTLPPSAIRFDFRGVLLPPRQARAIPLAHGLHHHGDAPEAAGYTIPELARLARSAFPAQRCIAYQTLGRILYRLGTDRYGPADADLPAGLGRCIHDGRVLDTLTAAAAAPDGAGHHRTAKTLAVEALWNWQRGGGKTWKAG